MNSIQSIRVRLGVTQSAFGIGIGVTQGNVSHYENGQKMPPHVAERLIAFASTLGVTLTYDEIYGAAQRTAPDHPPRKPPNRDNIMTLAVEQPALHERRTPNPK